MATNFDKTNYHVKVQLDGVDTPGNDKFVIWDESEGKFVLADKNKLSGAGCLPYDLSSTSQGSPGNGEITFNSVAPASITAVTASIYAYDGNSSTSIANMPLLLLEGIDGNAYFSFLDQNNNSVSFIASNFTQNGNTVEFNVATPSSTTPTTSTGTTTRHTGAAHAASHEHREYIAHISHIGTTASMTGPSL